MIDREARNLAIQAIEDFLDDRITAFEYDHRLHGIDSKDETLQQIVWHCWLFYDDFADHHVSLQKREWDFLQRLLLILHSDAEFADSTQKRRSWSWDHALAWIGVLAFILIIVLVGWGYHLLAFAIPFGLLSMSIYQMRCKRDAGTSSDEAACLPFSSASQIRWLLLQTKSFQKRRYRKELAARQIRSKAERRLLLTPANILWLIFGPVALFFQGMPEFKLSPARLTVTK